jgi:hypothetical protein
LNDISLSRQTELLFKATSRLRTNQTPNATSGGTVI